MVHWSFWDFAWNCTILGYSSAEVAECQHLVEFKRMKVRLHVAPPSQRRNDFFSKKNEMQMTRCQHIKERKKKKKNPKDFHFLARPDGLQIKNLCGAQMAIKCSEPLGRGTNMWISLKTSPLAILSLKGNQTDVTDVNCFCWRFYLKVKLHFKRLSLWFLFQIIFQESLLVVT